jgi:hypothetical protein
MRAKRVLFFAVLVVTGITIGHVLADGRRHRQPVHYRPATITGHGDVFTSADVSIPGQVTLNARASLLTSIHENPQYWFAKILAVDGKKYEQVWQHEYVEQSFIVPVNEEYGPTFTETVPLQPGYYFASVGVKDGQQPQASMGCYFTVK